METRLRWLFVLGSILFSVSLLRAAEFQLEGGVSPDRVYEVVVIADQTRDDAIRYAVRMRRSGKLLLTVPSSYQRDGEDDSGWDFRRSSAARVVWNSDASLVAIDEDGYRYIGELFLVRVARGRAVRVDLERSTLERAARLPWDRVSIHDPSWISERRLTVYLHGLVATAPSADPVHREFTASLEVDRHHKVRLKSLRAILVPGA